MGKTTRYDIKHMKPPAAQLQFHTWAAIDSSIAVDYHVHTSHTDGGASVQQMAKAAVEKGIIEILFSEHVRATSNYFISFALEVRALSIPGLNAYVGAEAKILDLKGKLDCTPQITSMCDAIIGSVHRPPLNKSGETQSWRQLSTKTALELEFQLALAIITKSQAHILGHPMGMVITTFDILPLEHLHELACACRDYDMAFELNARYCPNPEEWIDVISKANCKVSFGSDAHTASDIGSSFQLFMQKRRGEA